VLKALFGGDTRGWFSDQLSALDHKDSAQDLPGKWCIEWAELSTFKRASNDAVKAFVTRTVDHYRPSHGRNTVDIMRRGVFCATTNEEEFLYDPTGNRRYWVVNVRKWCDVSGMLAMRDQIWAEAKVRYQAGEQWWPERGEAAEIAAATEMYRVEDIWEETIREWFLNTPPTPVQNLSAKWFLYTIIGLTPDKCNRAHEMRITAVLKKLGFSKVFAGPNRNLKRWQPPATLINKIVPGQLALVK
jgi:putative DNA primase/helicase